MRFRLPPPRGLDPVSATLSVMVHALLVAVGVYATAVSARALEEMVSQRLAYLPPPDRRPNMEASREHLQYVDIGSGGHVAQAGDPANVFRQVESKAQDEQSGGVAADDSRSTAASQQVVSQDSVYSVLEVEERATRLEGSAAPQYPRELLQKRVEGSAFVRFVVDTTGHADPATVMIVSSTHEAFAQSVRTAVPQMLFTPATVQGLRVRQAVEQNFRFRLPPDELRDAVRRSRP